LLPLLLLAVGAVGGNEAELDVYITEGGLWGGNFDPDLVNETQFGTGTFSSGQPLPHFLVRNAGAMKCKQNDKDMNIS
jgi:hypothetical protein